MFVIFDSRYMIYASFVPCEGWIWTLDIGDATVFHDRDDAVDVIADNFPSLRVSVVTVAFEELVECP